MNFRISCVPHDDESVSVYFENFGHWDNFDWIVGLLEQENDCETLANDKSEFSRLAQLSYKGTDFLVWHNVMLGNYLYSTNAQDADTLKQLAENVIMSVTQKLKEKGLDVSD